MERTQTRPFAAILAEHRKGLTMSELSDSLANVAHAVMETGKTGSVTLKVTVKPGGDGVVQLADEITAKVPAGERGASIFYVDGEGNLSRRPPNQPELPGLEAVPTPAQAEEAHG